MKRIKNLHIGLIVLAFLITVVCLFGGQALTTKYKVEDPLNREMHKIKAVQKFRIKQEQDGVTVSLKLQKVKNLQVLLDGIRQKVQTYYNLPVKAFQITDHRNNDLEEVKYQLSFYLEEAVNSGHYIQLKDALEANKKVEARVYFSSNYIYLQLEAGQNYLYEVIPNGLQNVTVNNTLAGGESG